MKNNSRIIVARYFGKYLIAIHTGLGIGKLVYVDNSKKKESNNLSFAEAIQTLTNIGEEFYKTQPELNLEDMGKPIIFGKETTYDLSSPLSRLVYESAIKVEECSETDQIEFNTIKTLVNKLNSLSKTMQTLENLATI